MENFKDKREIYIANIMKQTFDNSSLGVKLLTAGTAACIADLATFPLDTAKVRMQVSRDRSVVFFFFSFLSFLFASNLSRFSRGDTNLFSRSPETAKPY